MKVSVAAQGRQNPKRTRPLLANGGGPGWFMFITVKANMKQRYRVFRRGWGTYYCEDLVTKQQTTLSYSATNLPLDIEQISIFFVEN